MVAPIANDELTRPERHVFLSPHYDDIALSCGGTAALLADAGRQPEVALIFGDHPDPGAPLTPFAEQMHRQWGLDAVQVIAGRRAEEAAAGRILGTRPLFLPFRDAIYRGERYLGDDQLFGEPAADEADLAEQIAEAAGLADPGSVRVYAPLAVGGHVDHRHAFGTGVWLARRGVEVWFYEDLPYALRPDACQRRVDQAGVPLRPQAVVDVSSVWERKLDAILAYPSQLSTVFEQYVGVGTSREEIDEAMGAYARTAGDGVPAERFWAVAAI
jgi:LmbE family N-acetylglucosaminyl deacetylase